MTSELVKNWLIKANNDVKAAENELSLPDSRIVTDAVCFHCQQAVEKFFKAYLISNKIPFEKTHNLEILREICAGKDTQFKNLELGNLTDFAIDLRYGDEFYYPSIEESREAFKLALKAKEFVLDKMEIKE